MKIFKYKKIFFIIGLILTTIVLGYLIYFLFFKSSALPKKQSPTQNTSTSSVGYLPTAQEGKQHITKNKQEQTTNKQKNILPQANPIARGGLTQTKDLTSKPTLVPTISQDGNSIQYYNPDDGKFYRVNQNGGIIALSDKVFHNVSNIVWSPNKNKAIIEYPDGANIIYDFNTQKQITLPKHWEEFDFSPNGDKIVLKSMGLDPDNRWIAISNDDGSKAKPIEPMGINSDKVITSWSPNDQIIAMYTKGIDFDRQEVFFVGLNNENFKSTIIEGRGFQPKWSPVGDKLVYSVYSSKNNMKPSLWVVDAQGDKIGAERKNLKIETWADKCAFANDKELYCAVPEDLPEGAGLFPELANNTKDKLYKINIQTGTRKLIAIPDKNYNISNLMISENGEYIYFTDKTTQKLHSIKLK